MNSILLSQTDNIYNCIGHLTIEYHNLQFPELHIYSIYLRKFFFSLGDTIFDDYWRRKKWDLRRIAFLLCGTPLSKSYLTREISRITNNLEQEIGSCTRLYPDFCDNFSNVISKAKSLLETDLDKIRSEVQSVIDNSSGTTAILIKDTKLIPVIEHDLNRLLDIHVEVVGISFLKKDICFENLIVIGPASPKWYPEFIFSSPRAKFIHVIN